jgi:hypothetical protein
MFKIIYASLISLYTYIVTFESTIRHVKHCEIFSLFPRIIGSCLSHSRPLTHTRPCIVNVCLRFLLIFVNTTQWNDLIILWGIISLNTTSNCFIFKSTNVIFLQWQYISFHFSFINASLTLTEIAILNTIY